MQEIFYETWRGKNDYPGRIQAVSPERRQRAGRVLGAKFPRTPDLLEKLMGDVQMDQI